MGLTKAERHNRMMDRIFSEAKRLQKQCENCRRLYYIKLNNCPNCNFKEKK